MGPSSELTSVPGTLVDVFGRGVLLQADSGCGKSDLALGLLDRGHQLVADDAVDLFTEGDGSLTGSCRDGFSGFIEIRGLGVINVVQLFGESAVSKAAKLGLVISLIDISSEVWKKSDRLRPLRRPWQRPNQMSQYSVPEIVMPYSNGRDMPLLIETAVRIHAQQSDSDMSADFEARLTNLLSRGAA